MKKSTGSHDHTGPTTRATAERITRLLDSESHRADVLHEEIPDWVDIVRRPNEWATRPATRPTPPKEKKVMNAPAPPKRRGKPHSKTDLEEAARAEVQAGLDRAGRKPCSVSAELFGHTGMAMWLRTGKGLGAANVAKALEWARSVPTVVTFSEPMAEKRRQVVAYYANGEAVHEWTTEPEEPALAPEPYPEVPVRPRDEIMAALTPQPETNPYQAMFGPFLAEFVRYKLEGMGVKDLDQFSITVSVERSA